MGKIRMTGGGGGGTSSDDCTVTAANVLADQTYMGADTDDEVGKGTLLNKVGTTTAATASLDTTNSRVQLTVPATGKYDTAAKLYAAYATIASLIGLTAAKLWPGNTVLGVASSNTSMSGSTITPSTATQTVSCSGKAMTSNIVVNPIPSNYYDANTQQTVFSYGTFGLAASLGAYYAKSDWTPFLTNPAVITGSGAIYLTGTSWAGTSGANTDRIIFRKAFPALLQYAQVTWSIGSKTTTIRLHVFNPDTLKSVGYAGAATAVAGVRTDNMNLSSYVSQLSDGWVLGVYASESIVDGGIFEIKLSPTAFS